MNLTLGKKIGLGFTLILALATLNAIVGSLTLSDSSKMIGAVKQGLEKNLFIVEREVDHLKWVQDLDLYLLNNQPFTGQLDDTKCGFGQWLYSKEIQETTVPELKQILNKVIKSHKKLHQSAATIINLKKSGNDEAAKKVYFELTIPALIDIREQLTKIREHYSTIEETTGKAATDMVNHVNRNIVFISVLNSLSIILGLILGVVIFQTNYSWFKTDFPEVGYRLGTNIRRLESTGGLQPGTIL